MARFYANENFPFDVVTELRLLGHDVLTVQEAGKGNQSIPDDEVLVFAVANNRAVLTINRKHFIRLHNAIPAHFGIVICTADNDFIGQAARIHSAIAAYPSLSGQLIRIYRPSK